MVVQLRVEDRLQGSQTFPTWKERITRILDVSDEEEHIDSTKVAPTDPTDLAAWKKIDFQSHADYHGWSEGPYSPSPFW